MTEYLPRQAIHDLEIGLRRRGLAMEGPEADTEYLVELRGSWPSFFMHTLFPILSGSFGRPGLLRVAGGRLSLNQMG